MFKSKTVFIVGAGASAEAGLPTGAKLKSQISNLVNVKYGDWGDKLTSGDPQVAEAFKIMARSLPATNQRLQHKDTNDYLHAAWPMVEALPLSISIDNYLDAHTGNTDAETVGKLGIARAILQAESQSCMVIDKDSQKLSLSRVENTWYADFIKLLTENVSKDKISHIFDNISFITFNYDRCIEHFLPHALATYYAIPIAEAESLVKKLKICHPYGKVGDLPWQNQNHLENIPFGLKDNPQKICKAASQIKTFTEQAADEDALAAMRNEIIHAETLVFLGFAFHEMNTRLLTPSLPTAVKRVFATAKGVSNSDLEVVKAALQGLINKSFDSQPREGRSLLNFGQNLTCHELFNEYWRSISN